MSKTVAIEQMVYHLIGEDGKPSKIKGTKNLSLVVDDFVSEIPAENMFIKVNSLGENYIKGYSVIYEIMEEAKIGFFDTESGKTIRLGKVAKPSFQMSDKIITQDKEKEYLSIIEGVILSKKQKEEEDKTSEEATKDESGEGSSPQSPEPEAPKVVSNEAYDKQRDDLVSQGYKEFVSDNFKVLLSKKHDEVLFMEIQDEEFTTYRVKELDHNEYSVPKKNLVFTLSKGKIIFQ